MPIRALLFDFDGLLVDTESAVLAAWQELYREHGHELPLDRWATIVGTLGGFDPLGHLDELAGPLADRAALQARTEQRELELSELEELRPGVLDYLSRARELALKTAIVSTSSRSWIDRHLGRLERAEDFDAIVAADHDPERAKPRPTLYLEALDTLEVTPDQAIAFEDSPNGVRAAKAAGIYTVAVPNAVTTALGIDGADLTLGSLTELPLDELLSRASRR